MTRACGPRANAALQKRHVKETYICAKKLLKRHIHEKFMAKERGTRGERP